MKSLRNLALAGAAALALAPATVRGADLPVPIPAPIADVGAWYLRGDIGISNQSVKKLESPAPGFDTAPVLTKGFDSGGIYDIGIGYKYSWVRFDVTGEYRAATTFNAFQTFGTGTDQYIGNKSEWLFLANLYVDLGTWYSITPFIGAGVGVDRLTIGNFTDFNVINQAVGYSGDSSKWNFAWALYAGLAYQITPNCTFELSYRYLSLGNGTTKDLIGFDGTNDTYNPIQFRNVYSNDIRIGLRWMLADGFMPAPYSEPLVRKY